MRHREEWKDVGEDEMWGYLRGAMAAKPVDSAQIGDILWWARGRDEREGGDVLSRHVDYLRHHLRERAALGGGWYAGERKVWTLGGVDFAMRWIPAGRFLMGAGEEDMEAFADEKPQREVTITRGFWMGETPVTQRQYQAIMGVNPSYFQEAGAPAPVEQVSWYDAAAFANKLSALEKLPTCFEGSGEEMRGVGDYVRCKGWRLPTEAEWEYAARAGTTTARSGEGQNIAWHGGYSDRKAHLVGLKEANAWGLHDMLGNVWEWCYDWFGTHPTQASTDPVGAATGAARVARGGGWSYLADLVRAARRDYSAPADRNFDLGFRLVRS